MNLEEKISEQLKEAIKSGNKLRMDTLRSIRAAIIEFNKSGSGRELNPDDELKLLQNQAKKRKDAIELYIKGNRPELAEREKLEFDIISEFLPAQLSDEEVKKIIAGIIKETGATDMKDLGRVMGPVMKELKGKADGGKVQQLVREILGGAQN